LSLTQMKTWRI
jgi:hypothetical protein